MCSNELEFHDGDRARIVHSLLASETSSACTLCDLSSTLEAEHEQMLTPTFGKLFPDSRKVTSTRSEVSHSKKHHDGEDVLEEDEVEACAMEVCTDADVDVRGATTMAEAAQRMSSEKNKKGAKLNTVGCCGVKYILAQAHYSKLLWCVSLYRSVVHCYFIQGTRRHGTHQCRSGLPGRHKS